jgi:dienelactone hydrolase
MRAAVGVVLACAVLAGCSSRAPRPKPKSRSTAVADAQTTPTAASPIPVSKPKPCGAGAHALWLAGPKGVKLEANTIGSGPDAVVFLHEIGRWGMCGFWEYAKALAAEHHVRAMLVNRCGYGESDCRVDQDDSGIIAETKPAVDWAREHGAKRVTLVGASGGGGDALQAGGVIRGVDAVVNLSGDVSDAGGDAATDARRLRVPILFAVSPEDRFCPLEKMRATYRLVPSRPKRLVVVSDRAEVHGWDLLTDDDGNWTPLADTVTDWVLGKLT